MIAYSAIALFCDIISVCTAPANSLHNERIHELMKSISGSRRSAEEAHDEDRCEDEEVVYPLVEDHSHS
jgi:hypothetical protein